jgi:hypothetical protein
MKRYFGLALITSVIGMSMGLNSCYYDNAEDLYPADTTTVVDTTIVYTYNAHAKTILDANCATAGCHIAGTGRQPFTTYAEVSAAIQNFGLLGRLDGSTGAIMPPSGSFPSSQIAILTSWINNNYPEN